MKAVTGFLAEDGTFFRTAIEAKRHDHTQAIRKYCDSQDPQIDFDSLMDVLAAIHPHVTGLFEHDYQIESNDQSTFGAAELEDEIDRELEEARQRKAALLGDVTEGLDDPDRDRDEAGEVDTDEPEHHPAPVNERRPSAVPQARPSPTNYGEGAGSVQAALKFTTRRPIPLSNLGGSPLPETVPDTFESDGT